jgi:hypothetical protein
MCIILFFQRFCFLFQIFLDDVGVVVSMAVITVVALVVVIIKVILFQPSVIQQTILGLLHILCLG